MALTPDTITRRDDLVGDVFLTFITPGGDRAQGIALVQRTGDPMGVTGTPLIAALYPTITIDDTTAVNVSVVTDGYNTPVTNYVPLTPGSAEVSAVISSSPTTLMELRVFLDPTVVLDRWVMLFDASSLPADTTVPLWRARIPGGSSIKESWNHIGLPFPSAGIVAAISSTPNTLTITGAEAYFQAVSLT